MAMLTFYLNRAGDNLAAAQRRRLESAKDELRALFGKVSPRPRAAAKTAATARKRPVRRATARDVRRQP